MIPFKVIPPDTAGAARWASGIYESAPNLTPHAKATIAVLEAHAEWFDEAANIGQNVDLLVCDEHTDNGNLPIGAAATASLVSVRTLSRRSEGWLQGTRGNITASSLKEWINAGRPRGPRPDG